VDEQPENRKSAAARLIMVHFIAFISFALINGIQKNIHTPDHQRMRKYKITSSQECLR
jgi:hypothetical protein